MSDTLLPCPFCGCATNEAAGQCADIGDGQYSIWCEDCLGEGPVAESPNAAVENWNRRSSSPGGEREKVMAEAADFLLARLKDPASRGLVYDMLRALAKDVPPTEEGFGTGSQPAAAPHPSRAAWESVLVGGNHLADILIKNLGGDFADRWPPDTDPTTALHSLGVTDNYDVWCYWAAIMQRAHNPRGST